MYVKGVKSGVCGFYTTLYTEYRFNGTHVEGVKSVLCIQSPPPGEKAALLTFWDLSNYKGSFRQDAQPTPNS